MNLLDKIAALTGVSMALKELLRDIVLNLCAACHYGQRPGYPVRTFIDEDAYGPEESITNGTNVTRYLATTLNDIYLDQCRITIPTMGTAGDGVQIQITIGGVALFPAAITVPSPSGTVKFGIADFASSWLTTPVPDGSRINVVTTRATPGGDFTPPSGLRVRLEGRWM